MNLYVMLGLANVLMLLLAVAWLSFRNGLVVRRSFGEGRSGPDEKEVGQELRRLEPAARPETDRSAT